MTAERDALMNLLENDGGLLLTRLIEADRLAREVMQAVYIGDRPRRIIDAATRLAHVVLGDAWRDAARGGGQDG